MARYFRYPVMLFKEIFNTRKDKTLHFPQIGWTLTIPKKFELVTDKKINNMSERGAKLLEATAGEAVHNPAHTPLFLAAYQIHNMFTCSIADLNDQKEAEWQMYNERCANAFEKLQHQRYKNFVRVSIQTEKDLRQKGSIVFDTVTLTISTPNRLLNKRCFYNTIYKNHGVNITMAYADEKIGEEMLDILRKSTFEN